MGSDTSEECATMTVEEIDTELLRCEYDLNHYEGTPCEVYQRIVGYYRSVANWNPGKKAEYAKRVLYDQEWTSPR